MAGKFQGVAVVERMDDLAKDQLHSCQPSQGGLGENYGGLSMVELQILLRARNGGVTFS